MANKETVKSSAEYTQADYDAAAKAIETAEQFESHGRVVNAETPLDNLDKVSAPNGFAKSSETKDRQAYTDAYLPAAEMLDKGYADLSDKLGARPAEVLLQQLWSEAVIEQDVTNGLADRRSIKGDARRGTAQKAAGEFTRHNIGLSPGQALDIIRHFPNPGDLAKQYMTDFNRVKEDREGIDDALKLVYGDRYQKFLDESNISSVMELAPPLQSEVEVSSKTSDAASSEVPAGYDENDPLSIMAAGQLDEAGESIPVPSSSKGKTEETTTSKARNETRFTFTDKDGTTHDTHPEAAVDDTNSAKPDQRTVWTSPDGKVNHTVNAAWNTNSTTPVEVSHPAPPKNIEATPEEASHNSIESMSTEKLEEMLAVIEEALAARDRSDNASRKRTYEERNHDRHNRRVADVERAEEWRRRNGERMKRIGGKILRGLGIVVAAPLNIAHKASREIGGAYHQHQHNKGQEQIRKVEAKQAHRDEELRLKTQALENKAAERRKQAEAAKAAAQERVNRSLEGLKRNGF